MYNAGKRSALLRLGLHKFADITSPESLGYIGAAGGSSLAGSYVGNPNGSSTEHGLALAGSLPLGLAALAKTETLTRRAAENAPYMTGNTGKLLKFLGDHSLGLTGAAGLAGAGLGSYGIGKLLSMRNQEG